MDSRIGIGIGALGLMIVLLCVITVGQWMNTAQAADNRGAADIVLEGGRTGDVPFPHHRHQDAAAECATCHDVFPQERGVIQKMIASGDLEKKTVMNDQCKNCHIEAKNAGNASGPTSCKKCHSLSS